jgi:hypothetical protein
MKIIITESQYNKAIDQFITFILEPHEVKRSEKYPDSIFWVKGEHIIAEINKTPYFYLNFKIWGRIESMFELKKYPDIKEHLQRWIEKHYDLGGLTPSLYYPSFLEIEVHDLY